MECKLFIAVHPKSMFVLLLILLGLLYFSS